MKFLVDECVRPRVAEAVVRAGHDAVHVRDLGLLGASDHDVVANLRHYAKLVAALIQTRTSGKPSKTRSARAAWSSLARVFGVLDGAQYAAFDRTAASFAEALRSALVDLMSAFEDLRVARLAPDEFVTLAEIAKRTVRDHLLPLARTSPGDPTQWIRVAPAKR